MITSININNANRYSILFDEISKNLNEAKDNEEHPYRNLYNIILKGKNEKLGYELFWNEEGNIEINSLELYFGIIEDLVKIKPSYGILPLISDEISDEPCFEINANTRVINIPRNFSVQVQGDEQAETIYFQIDRYFDTTDLSKQDIYIQWELPGINDKGKKEKGFSRPWIKDTESKPGFIIFGWALSSQVTSKSGDVKFSVKFIKKDDNGNIVYSLNTLPATLSIKQGLILDFTDAIEDTSTLRFQNGAIKGTLSASKPIISENLNDSLYFIDPSEKNYQLQVCAVSPDAGSLSATWHRSDSETGKGTSLGNSKTINITYKITKNDIDENNFDLMINGIEKLDESFIDNHECYLIDKETEQLTTRISSLEELKNKFKVNQWKNIDIGVPFYAYDVNQPGYYYCSVSNRVGLQTNNTSSKKAYFPKPIKPLPSHTGVKREGYKTEGTELTDQSRIDPSNNINIIDKTQYVYQWSKLSSENKYVNIEGGTKEKYTVTEPGFYQCSVYCSLNKENTDPVSSLWEVVTAPDLDIKINGLSANQYIEAPLCLPVGQNTTVTIKNMSEYDKVTYIVHKIGRGENSDIIGTITEGTLLLSNADTSFSFISVNNKCKITCKGYVGITSEVSTEDFTFYIDASSSNE